MARVLCKRTDLYPYHLVVNSFLKSEIPNNYKQISVPFLLRAKNINYNNVHDIVNDTNRKVILWDHQFVKNCWDYRRTWKDYPDFRNVNIVSATKICQALGCMSVLYCTYKMINQIINHVSERESN